MPLMCALNNDVRLISHTGDQWDYLVINDIGDTAIKTQWYNYAHFVARHNLNMCGNMADNRS
jgi:hypothetical protein